MARQILTPEELREYLMKQVNQVHEVKVDNAKVEPGMPTWNEPDLNGCNWSCNWVHGDPAYAPAVRAVVFEAQKHFNLPDREV